MSRLHTYLVLLALAVASPGITQDRPEPGSSSGPSKAVAIGLLLPDHSRTDVIKAAELAIEEANAEGGRENPKFRLVIRYAEGFWGAGSKESVGLVYDDHVCSIIGALDGRNGHLAEQVATKSHLTYIETSATEPTLSQAFVPWFMRVVPNDNQQAAVIMKEIRREGEGRICILSTEDYDTRYAVRSLTRAAARETGRTPLIVSLDTAAYQKEVFLKQILDRDPAHLVIPFDASFLGDLIASLRTADPSLHIYGTLHFTTGVERRGARWQDYDGVRMISPRFERDPLGAIPDSRSAYMYDAVRMVIRAVQHVGRDREEITGFISEAGLPDGATGRISFDELGNRLESPSLVFIENGRPEWL